MVCWAITGGFGLLSGIGMLIGPELNEAVAGIPVFVIEICWRPPAQILPETGVTVPINSPMVNVAALVTSGAEQAPVITARNW
jgi:hypothetical protein